MGKNENICDCSVIHKDLVQKAEKDLLSRDLLEKITKFYKTLADSTRIRIINALEKNELCVCDLAVLLNMTKSAVSHQLKYLRQMCLIKNRRDGKEVYYSLDDNHVNQVFDITIKHILERENENK